ncbi:unnamed protein product [Owenia fusiformis]|uniref:C-type lectin domain-containing protein n=1 Tax=Owenia fusiformis TaxID=6347 RepID=A0A8S4NMS1_OWEFU|nr:unnamed protein product [Owenia fusiformis]
MVLTLKSKMSLWTLAFVVLVCLVVDVSGASIKKSEACAALQKYKFLQEDLINLEFEKVTLDELTTSIGKMAKTVGKKVVYPKFILYEEEFVDFVQKLAKQAKKLLKSKKALDAVISAIRKCLDDTTDLNEIVRNWVQNYLDGLIKVMAVDKLEGVAEMIRQFESKDAGSRSNRLSTEKLMNLFTKLVRAEATWIKAVKGMYKKFKIGVYRLPKIRAEKEDTCKGNFTCTGKEDWKLVGSRCFLSVASLAHYSLAQKGCMDRGGHVASIHNKDENNYLASELRIGKADHAYYIGLNDIDNEGEFVWHDGSPVDFEFWASNDGKKLGVAGVKDDCTQMMPHIWGYNGHWRNVPCNYGYGGYFCSKPATLKSQGLIPDMPFET